MAKTSDTKKSGTKKSSAAKKSGTKNATTDPHHDHVVGRGGETHQVRTGDGARLTTSEGVPVADGQNSLAVGERGPVVLDDFVLRGKVFHFDHERIPERVVHARGYGAHGVFETYEPTADLTSADLFQRAGETTPVFVRFSTVAGNKGSSDLVHAVKDEPDRGFMWQMSDRTIPRSFRFMEGFGVHTFRFIDADGGSRFVKFHWKPEQGLQSVLWNEAANFTQLPVNAPKCPVARYQQDGHMAFTNPMGRVNYEPNSWGGADVGPREDPRSGYRPAEVSVSGETRRARPQSFADHYSQARQFLHSQTETEQVHMVDSFVFELSKVERLDIRERTVANLRNVDDDFAIAVADAHAHCKFVGHTADAMILLEAAGVADKIDDGYVELGSSKKAATGFFDRCAQLRYWERESSVMTL